MITIRNTLLLTLLAVAFYWGIDLWDLRSGDAREFHRLWEMGQRREALEFLDDALERRPNDSSLHQGKVFVCLSRDGGDAPERAAAALRAMEGKMGGNAVLRRSLGDGSPVVRRNAALTVGLVRMERARGTLQDRVQDREIEVRIAAVRALGDLGDRRSTFHLLLALRDMDPGVRAEALRSLALVGAAGEARRMFRYLHDEDGDVRRSAREALLALAPDGPRREYERRLEGGSPGERAVAAACLASMGDARGGEILRAAIRDHDAPERVLAVELLAEVDPAGAARFLSDLAKDEPDRAVRAAMERVLAAGGTALEDRGPP